MGIIAKHGSYEVIEYGKDLVTIDFCNENIGMTVKSFSDREKALRVFNSVILPLSARDAILLKEDTRKAIVYSV